jgi:CRISPR-associated protein Cmr6
MKMGIDRIYLDSSKKQLKFYSGNTEFCYYIYDNLMKAINPNNPKVDNTALLINKFSNIFNKKEIGKSKNGLDLANNNKDDLKKSYEQTHTPINFKAEVNDKLVIGLGGHSVYETDITLHHIYGVPYIPASAIKGSFRNWIINKYFINDEDTEKIEKKAMENIDFLKIFGGTKDKISYQGQVIFMDSFPIDSYTIKRDVMTPHHSEYYTKEDVLPLDSDSVTPISFLVVTDTNFEFNIFVDNFIENNIVDDYFELEKETKLKVFIEEEIKDMLTYQGLGGKTSAGYGYFDMK